LLTDTVLADARKLVDEVAAQELRGPRIDGQVEQLGRLITLASQPIAVRLTSDQLTTVTLYRVGSLGAFASRDVELRPGTYTVIGSRDGYRDVRMTFTVRPGGNLDPIPVVYVEPGRRPGGQYRRDGRSRGSAEWDVSRGTLGQVRPGRPHIETLGRPRTSTGG
jgi:hypothetical protein